LPILDQVIFKLLMPNICVSDKKRRSCHSPQWNGAFASIH
jgi:hypothetical protein